MAEVQIFDNDGNDEEIDSTYDTNSRSDLILNHTS